MGIVLDMVPIEYLGQIMLHPACAIAGGGATHGRTGHVRLIAAFRGVDVGNHYRSISD